MFGFTVVEVERCPRGNIKQGRVFSRTFDTVVTPVDGVFVIVGDVFVKFLVFFVLNVAF